MKGRANTFRGFWASITENLGNRVLTFIEYLYYSECFLESCNLVMIAVLQQIYHYLSLTAYSKK